MTTTNVMDREYTLSDFTAYTSEATKYDHSKESYDKFEYPEYERLCMRAQKYIKRHPKECMHNLTLITPEKVQIWDAIRDGDLTRLKALHNEGHSIGFYVSSQMDVACEYKHLHIVQYLYEKGIGYHVDILSHFPVLKNAVDEKTADSIKQLEDKIKMLQNDQAADKTKKHYEMLNPY